MWLKYDDIEFEVIEEYINVVKVLMIVEMKMMFNVFELDLSCWYFGMVIIGNFFSSKYL